MTNISITKAISMSVEEFQKLQLSELAELHKLLADSKQKKALRKADLVAGVITAKKKERKSEEQAELVGAENSVKTPKKPTPKKADPITEELKKPTPKLVKPSKPKQAEELKKLAGEDEEQPQEQSKGVTEDKPQEQEQEQQEPTFKRPTQEQPDFANMTKEELMKYVATLEAKTEKFPKVIDGQKTKYTRTEFENVKAIQDVLLKNPMNLYIFADERIDEKKTQFLVLFASSECLVLLDRNRQKNTTITFEMKNVTATHLKFPKEKSQFEYAFYIREKK